MFLLRSAFWLTVAFVAIRPGVDFGSAAGTLSAHALAQGQAFIAGQIADAECGNLSCLGAKAAVTVALSSNPSADASQDAAATGPVPFPRPRPAWMG